MIWGSTSEYAQTTPSTSAASTPASVRAANAASTCRDIHVVPGRFPTRVLAAPVICAFCTGLELVERLDRIESGVFPRQVAERQRQPPRGAPAPISASRRRGYANSRALQYRDPVVAVG